MRGPARRAAALALLFLGGLAASCTSRWQFVRQRPDGKAETLVTVRSSPPGAEITLNGNYLGDAPLEVPIRYPFETRVYQRRTATPYPHVEEKEVRTYKRHRFTFYAAAAGRLPVQRTLVLSGEKRAEVLLTLPPQPGE